MKDDDAYLLMALDIAVRNRIEKLPRMGAILVSNVGDIFYGQNQYKTHPLQAKWGTNPKAIFLHAEIDALVRAIREYNTYSSSFLLNSSIYIARVDKKGFPALAKPCAGCMGALIHFGIENVRWTE